MANDDVRRSVHYAPCCYISRIHTSKFMTPTYLYPLEVLGQCLGNKFKVLCLLSIPPSNKSAHKSCESTAMCSSCDRELRVLFDVVDEALPHIPPTHTLHIEQLDFVSNVSFGNSCHLSPVTVSWR